MDRREGAQRSPSVESVRGGNEGKGLTGTRAETIGAKYEKMSFSSATALHNNSNK